MKTAVVYYSYSGKTKIAAEELAKKCSADIRRIEDVQKPGIVKMLFLSLQAVQRKGSPIKPIAINMQDYGRIIIGAPVWAWRAAPQVNSFIDAQDFKNKKVIVFFTAGGSAGKTLERLSERIQQQGGLVVGSFCILTGGKKNEAIAKEAQTVNVPD